MNYSTFIMGEIHRTNDVGMMNPTSLTIEEAKILFIIDRLTSGRVISRDTFATYLGELQWSVYFLEDKELPLNLDISQFGYNMLTQFTAYLRTADSLRDPGERLSKKRIHNIIGRHKSMIDFVIRREYVAFTSFDDPRKFENISFDKKVRQIYTTDQLIELAKAIPISNYAGRRNLSIMSIMIGRGLRLEEVITLRTSDLDLINKSLQVKGKGGKEREILFDDDTADIIKVYLETRKRFIVEKELENASDHLFLSSKMKGIGGKIDGRALQKSYKTYGKKTPYAENVNFFPHGFRHTFATFYLIAGGEPEDLQRIMGHEKIETTMGYVHLSQTHPDIYERISIFQPQKPRDKSEMRIQWEQNLQKFFNIILEKLELPPMTGLPSETILLLPPPSK